MLSLSIHHIIFVEFFHACIALQVSIRIFLIGNMRMLQVFLYHHQIYFLLLLFNLIFHLFLRSLIFHQDLPFLLEHHLLQAFSMCLQQLKFAYFLYFVHCDLTKPNYMLTKISTRKPSTKHKN